ncbi:MAG: monomethylamine:corrinoid methyltransferase [Chloroflexi bacterium]|nr:monomethylamine:corrinoid methyltransferase [Chloroflexota bacterium]
MIDFKEFIKRSMDGPVMAEQEFDLKLCRCLRRLVVDYGVHFTPAEIICDDATADAIFQAGVELLAEVGVYNIDTSRVIDLTEEEIRETCRDTPKQCTLGSTNKETWHPMLMTGEPSKELQKGDSSAR